MTNKKSCRTRLNTLDDITSEVCRVYRMMKEGSIAPKDGSKLVYALQQAFNMMNSLKTARAVEKLEETAALLMEGQIGVGTDDEIAEAAKGLRRDRA